MRNFNNINGLSTQIKAGLQACHKVLNKNKQHEREYRLFSSLAELYLQKESVDYPKAVAIYQYLKKLVEKHLNDDKDKLVLIDKRIRDIELKFVERVKKNKSDSRNREQEVMSIEGYKEGLANFRESVKAELVAIEDLGVEKDKEELNEERLKERAQEVERIYMGIREFFIGKRDKGGALTDQGLVNKLIADCIKQLGGLPKVGNDKHEVEYAIFGMGSMALGTMTPWSDLEFGILIEEGLTQEDEKRVKEYFRNITTLLHIKVVNFGETPLRMMGIKELNNFKINETFDPSHNWFYDDYIDPGFSFDGPHSHACKIPLGRKGYKGHKDFELISTSNGIAEFQEEAWYESNYQLVQALGHTILINGNPNLFTDYQNKLKRYDNLISSRAFKILKADSITYNPELVGSSKEGALYNVKKEIYRLPDRTILALGDCFNVRGSNNWELISNIYKKGIIKDTGAINLGVTFSISAEIRLITYSANNAQKENLSVLEKSDSYLEVTELINKIKDVFYLKDLKLLYRYYFTMLALQHLIEISHSYLELSDNIQQLGLEPRGNLFYKGLINQRFLLYVEAKKCYIEFIDELSKQGITIPASIYGILANVHNKLDENDEAELCYNKALEVQKKALNTYGCASTLNNLGLIHHKKGKYEEAIQYFTQSLILDKANQLGYASSLNNLALVYEDRSEFAKAKRFYKKALDIRKKILGSNDHAYADSLNNIGSVHYNQGIYKNAIYYFKKALQIKERIFGENHPEYVYCLNNIGASYDKECNYDRAISYFEQSLNIQRKIFGRNVEYYAASLHNIAIAYNNKGKYEEAIYFHEQALEIREKLFGKYNPRYTKSLLNLANAYLNTGCYKEAIERYEQILKTNEKFLGTNHIDATTLNNIGEAYRNQDKYEEAIYLYKEALKISKKIFGENHIEQAPALNNMGLAYYSKKRYNKAISYHNKALNLRRKALGDNHPDYADSLNNIGIIYNEQGKYRQALGLYKEVIRIYDKVLGKAHPRYFASLINLGNSYVNSGQYEAATEIFISALEITKKIGDTINLIRVLSILGIVLKKQRQYEEALVACNKAYRLLESTYGLEHSLAETIISNIIGCELSLGNNCILQGKTDEAKKYYAKYGRNPLDVEVQTKLARLAYDNNNVEEAIEHYEVLVKLSPNNSEAYYRLGLLYHIQARQAEEYGDGEIARERKEKLQQQTNKNFISSLRFAPSSGVFIIRYGYFLYSLNYAKEAAINFLKAAQLDDSEIVMVFGATERLIVDNEMQNEVDFHGVINIKARLFAAYQLVRCYNKLSQPYNALRILELCREEVETNKSAILYSLLGYCYKELKQFYEAALSFDKARSLCKHYTLAIENYNLCLNLHNVSQKSIKIGQEDAQSDTKTSIVIQEPANINDYNNRLYIRLILAFKEELSLINWNNGNIAKVIRHIEEIKDLTPEEDCNWEITLKPLRLLSQDQREHHSAFQSPESSKGDNIIQASIRQITMMLSFLTRKYFKYEILDNTAQAKYRLNLSEQEALSYVRSLSQEHGLEFVVKEHNNNYYIVLEHIESSKLVMLVIKEFQMKCYKEAFERGIAISNIKVYHALGDSYYKTGNLDFTIRCYEMLSEKLTPQDRSVKHNLACMYHVKAQKEQNHKSEYEGYLLKARAAFKHAISLNLEDSPHASNYIEYAQFLLKYHDKNNKEEYSEIISILEKASKRNDESYLGYNQLEKTTICEPLQELLNKRDKISIKPITLSYYLLIKLHLIHSNIELACKILEEYKKQLEPLQTVEDYLIGYHLLRAAHTEIVAESINEVSTESAQSSMLPSTVCRMIAEYEGSLSYDQALRLNSEGTRYFKGKDYKTAIVIFSKAAGLSYSNPLSEVLYNRGRTYHESGNIDEAIKDYQELIRINPNHVKAYYQIGMCFKQKGNFLQAETFLRQAMDKDPKFEMAQKALDEINKVISGSLGNRIEQQRSAQQQSYQR